MYNNTYNREISKKINDITQAMINHENQTTNTGPEDHKITSRLESMCIRNKNCHGGSGYAMATLGDHGFAEDQMEGVTGSGVSAAGISAAGVSAAGKRRTKKGSGIVDTIAEVAKTAAEFAPLLLAAGQPKKSKKVGGELSLIRYKDLKGQPLPTAPANTKITVSAGPPPPSENFRGVTRENRLASYAGGAKARARSKAPNSRIEIVKKVMKERNLSLPMASKYVKEHGLY